MSLSLIHIFAAYSGVLLAVNNFNLGNVLPGLLGLPLLIYGIFAPVLNRWFSHGLGKAVKWIFIAGYLFLIGVFTVFGIMMGTAANTAPPQNADAVLVLGAALKGTEPSDTLCLLYTSFPFPRERAPPRTLFARPLLP